jgi:hypothetical protein
MFNTNKATKHVKLTFHTNHSITTQKSNNLTHFGPFWATKLGISSTRCVCFDGTLTPRLIFPMYLERFWPPHQSKWQFTQHSSNNQTTCTTNRLCNSSEWFVTIVACLFSHSSTIWAIEIQHTDYSKSNPHCEIKPSRNVLKIGKKWAACMPICAF